MLAAQLVQHFLLQGATAAPSVPSATPPAGPDANAVLEFTGVILAAVLTIAVTVWLERGKRKQTETELTKLRAEIKDLAGLPRDAPDSFAQALASLQQVVLYRQTLVLDLVFEPIPESERLLVHMTVSYKIVNYGKDPVDYKVRARIVPEGTDAGTRLVRISGSGEDLGAQSFDESYPEEGAAEREVARDVVIRPNNQNPKNLFQLHMRNIASQNGSDVFFMRDPTVDVEVRVTKRPENLAVDVQFGHSAGDELERMAGRWRLRRAFLPWQSVHVTWSTKPASPAIAASHPVAHPPTNSNAPT